MTLSNATLVAVTLAYAAIALASAYLATVFSGYALANIGLIVAL